MIGSDTVVTFGGRIYGKPTSEQSALETLQTLSGNSHVVYSGVCLLLRWERKKKVMVYVLTDHRLLQVRGESVPDMDLQ